MRKFLLPLIFIFTPNAFGQDKLPGIEGFIGTVGPEETRKLEQIFQSISPTIREELRMLLKLMPVEDAKKSIEILADLPGLEEAEMFVEILKNLSRVERGDFISAVYLIPSVEGKVLVIRKKLEALKELLVMSPVERFFTIGTLEKPMELKPLRQVGYEIFRGRAAGLMINPPGNYILGPGDELLIYIWGIGASAAGIDYPICVTVARDGRIFLPKIGPISVWGLTLKKAEKIIQGVIPKVLGDVQVSCTLSEMRGVPVLVLGEVENPGIVVLSGALSPFDAILAAGGITKKGSLRRISIIRQGNKIAEVDFYKLVFEGRVEDAIAGIVLQEYDVTYVPPIGDTFAVAGNVKRPGIYELKKNERVSDAIRLAGGLTPKGASFRVVLKRYSGGKREVIADEIVSIKDSKSILSMELKDGDFIEILPAYAEEARKYIIIAGYVNTPGKYEFFDGMTLEDVIVMAKGFPEAATPESIEITRRINATKDKRFSIKITEAMENFDKVKLKPFDRIVVISPPPERVVHFITVEVQGEVRHPGTYTIKKGERISEVLERAGGFTEDAFPEGIVFIRQTILTEQKKRLDDVMKLLLKELLTQLTEVVEHKVMPQIEQTILAERVQILRRLSETVPVGRVILKVPRDISKLKGRSEDIVLEDGDKIFVPRVPEHVLVVGEVRNPSALLFVKGKPAKWYIKKVGGFLKSADKGEIFIIRASGEAVPGDLSEKLKPGDTIVVPAEIEIPLRKWLIVKDALSLSFQGISSAMLVWGTIIR